MGEQRIYSMTIDQKHIVTNMPENDSSGKHDLWTANLQEQFKLMMLLQSLKYKAHYKVK